MHVYTSYDSRLNSTKKFSFVRGGEPLGFVIGQNHMHYLWEACDATDAECQEADLFEKVYHSNQTSAALGALGHIRSWGFNGVGYDNGGFTPADDEAGRVIMANGPFYVLTEITKTSSWMPSITYPDPWDPATASHIGASITRQVRLIIAHGRISHLWLCSVYMCGLIARMSSAIYGPTYPIGILRRHSNRKDKIGSPPSAA